jgi:hypothetical protein
MRWILALLVTVIGGCGADSDGGSSGDDEQLEALRLEVDPYYCASSLGGCSVSVKGALTKDTFDYDSAKWSLVFTYSVGVAAPACDGDNTKDGGVGEAHQYSENFAMGREFTFRACAWNKTANTYSEGITKTVTMPETDG